MQTQALLRDLIDTLRRKDHERLLEALAREINNHVFIRATFQSGAQELTSDDMQFILTRFEIVERTLALSARGPGPEAFAPRHSPSNRIASINQGQTPPPIDPRVLAGLEDDLRTSRAVR